MAALSKKHEALQLRARALNLNVTEVKGYLIPYRGSHNDGYFCKNLDAVEQRLAEMEREIRHE